MKRQLAWVGYKVHVTEACDDDAAHLITHVETCPAMRPDMASTAEIHDCLAAKGLLPSEHFVDSGYVDAGLLAGSRRDHGVSLEGPVRGTSSRQARAGGGYDLPHFAIDWEGEWVTCPQGKASVSWRLVQGGDGSKAHPCPVRPLGLQGLRRQAPSARQRRLPAAPSFSIRARSTRR